MKKVISLIGIDRGNERYMHPHEADAAVSTGAACWPEDFAQDAEVVEEEPFEDFSIRELAGVSVLQGDWPERAVITSRLRNAGHAQVFRTGTAILTFGNRKAVYQSIGNVGKSSDLKAILREVQDLVDEKPEAEDEAPARAENVVPFEAPAAQAESIEDAQVDDTGAEENDIFVPEGWGSLHWKQRVQLASQIKGEEVTGVAEANSIIEEYVSN